MTEDERRFAPPKPAFPQPVSGTVVPRFGDVATFMRLPLFRDPADVEIGMVGVPWDGGTTNRPGARHGPRQMRDLSTMMRRVHHVTGVAPYELAKCGDLGDAPVNPAEPRRFCWSASKPSSPSCTRPARCRCRPAATT